MTFSHVPKDKLIVIASHIPLITEADDGISPVLTGPRTENFGELLKTLEPFENIYAIAGHDTSNSFKVQINHQHGWNGKPGGSLTHWAKCEEAAGPETLVIFAVCGMP